MAGEKWYTRHLTDAAQRILKQVPDRADDCGLEVVDDTTIVMMALWSLLLGGRKVGRGALEQMGVDRFDLARELGGLLDQKGDETPVAYDPKRQQLWLVKTGEPYRGWDFEGLLEPLLREAEHEALGLGHKYVGSEHLLLAIVRLADPALSELLRRHGAEYGRVKETVLRVLQS
jgi:hypothetical protein